MVYVFFAKGFEEIEALTVIDMLRRANIQVSMISVEDGLQVTGAHNITVSCDDSMDHIKGSDMEMLICPGGMPGTTNLQKDKRVIDLLREQHEKGGYIAAICAAPIILEGMGLLKGKRAVCYPDREEQLVSAIVLKEKVVQDQNIITSRGMGTAIEFAAKIIALLKDEETAQKILDAIIY